MFPSEGSGANAMTTGPLSKTIVQLSRLEVCRNASSYWSFSATLILLLDLLIAPSLVEITNFALVFTFLVLRIFLFFLLSVDRVAENVSYAIRVNWELIKVLRDSAKVVKVYRILVAIFSLFAITLLFLSYHLFVSSARYWNLTMLNLVIVINMLNSLLYSLIIRPKAIALGALAASTASIIDTISMYFITKRPSGLILSEALAVSDVFVILGMNLLGVTLCQNAES